MKKFLALTALVLGLASCQTEPEGLDVNVGGAVDTVVTVNIPENETRAGGSNSATSDINAILATDDYTMRYMLQVFYGDKPSELYVRYSDNQKVSFPVRLVPGQDRDYNFVVWADIVEQVAGLEDDVKCDDLHYDIGADLREISVNDDKWVAMDETRDAFTAVKLVEDYTGSQTIDIDLYRPFAKLRVITTDMVELTKHDIIPTTAVVTYKTKHRVAYNALTGEAADASATKEHSYPIAAYGDNTETDRVLFTDYFFADDEVVKFEMLVKDQDDKEIVTRSFNTDIFVKRNYLTTLKGDILTNGTDVNVEVKPGFDGENGKVDGETFANVDTVEELMEAINKGVTNITLDGDINLLSAGTLSTRADDTKNLVIEKELTIDFAGYTITGAVERNYGVIENKGTLTVKNGTIKSTLENGGSAIWNYGTLTMTDMTINGAPTNTAAGTAAYAVNNEGVGSATVLNNVNVSGRGAIGATNGAKVEINGGTYHTPEVAWGHAIYAEGEGTEIVVNDGIFSEGYEMNANNWGMYQILSCESAKVIVYGGDFGQPWDCANGYDLCTQTAGTIVIYGGTFAENPSSQNGIDYVVKGYKAEQENGVYVVRKPQALIVFENAIANGDNVTLNEDITLIDPVVVAEGKEVTINLNGKTLDIYTHKSVGAVLKNNGTLAIEGGVISSKANNGGSAIANNGTLTVKNATLNGAPNADGSWPAYTVNNTGTMTLENSTITSKHGSVCSYGEGAVLTLNNCTIDMAGIAGFTSHGIYTYSGGKVVVNGGTYVNNATDQNATGASVINGNVEVNAGTFTGRIENYYGTPVLKGGTYSVKPKDAFVAEGYKVIEKDGKFNVVLDSVDNVATSDNSLDEAIKGGATTIALNAGEYVIPDSAKGKTITFIGTGNPEDTIIAAQDDGGAEGDCDYSLDGATVTFENVTITTTSTYFPGYARCKGTYKNCIINGVFTLYDNSSFEKCTFNVSGDIYNVWTWGAAEATFTNCTFNCDGKAMLLYGTANTKLTMNNCVFNDNGDDTVTGKAAIETGNDYNKSYELTVNNATVNGFAINPNGINTNTTLWANKNSMPADKLKVTVDGLTWKADGLVEDAEGNTIATNVSGLKTALTEGTDVTLEDDMEVEKSESDSNGYGATGINQNNGGTIDGGGNDFGADVWGTWDSAINTTGGTIKNINIVKGFRGIFVNHNSDNCSKVYLENVTIDGPTYTISCDQGTNQGLEAIDSTFNGWTSYAATIGDVKFVYCTFGEGAGYAFCRPYAPTEFVGCEFEEGYTIDPRAAVTFENCTLNGVTLTAENIADLVTDTAKVTIK